MSVHLLQFFFFLIALALPAGGALADLSVGETYALNFADVDGNKFSTVDGRSTVVVIATTADQEKARLVGDRMPDYCLGNPAYRMITVLAFQKDRSKPMRAILTVLICRRLNAEAKRLQTRYAAKGIPRDARRDVFAVADFDGSAVTSLGYARSSPVFHVLVFGRNGTLLQQWNEVPAPDELAAVMK